MPVLVVGTYRNVGLDVGRPLARALEGLLRQRLAHRITLRRLPQSDVAAMLRVLSGQDPPAPLVQAIYSETEGNPFFVEEVFHHLAEEGKLFGAEGRWRSDLQVSELDVPEGVRLVIGRRLERVGEECHRVLTAAAVIGGGFSFELLQALGDVDVDVLLDAVDEAERAHLIASTSDGPEVRFTFAHELIRQTLVSGLSLPRRQRLHLRVAEAIERAYSRSIEEHASELADHLSQAGAAADPEKTARYLTLAGEQALAAAAYAKAVSHYERALQALERKAPVDEAQRCHLLLGLGEAQRRLGDADSATETFQQAGAIARRLGAPQWLARAALGFGRGGVVAGVVDELLVRLLEEALTAPGGEGGAPGAGLWRAGLAYLYSELGREVEARREFEALAASDFAAVRQSPSWLSIAILLSPVCAFLEDGPRAGTLYEVLLPFARRNVEIQWADACYGSSSRYLGLLGATMCRWEEAAHHFEDALEMHTRMEAGHFVARTQLDYARMLIDRHRPSDRDKARHLLTEAIAMYRKIGMPKRVEMAEEMLGEIPS